jgi:GntR family transcriptional regulator of vanillate catabolism
LGTQEAADVVVRLREMILAGELPGGARIAELTLVEKLGVSRTPIRAALMRLEQEGLLEALPNGGYAVRTFSERDVSDAIELRGTVEGLLARVAAERGARRWCWARPANVCARSMSCFEQAALDDHAFSATWS